MSGPLRIEVEGIQQLRSFLRKMEDKDLLGELKQANKEASTVVANESKRQAPQVSGRLAKSTKPKFSRNKAGVKAGTPKRVPYSGPIHFGWRSRNIDPNQFIYRAITIKIDQVQNAYEKDLQRLVDKL